MPTSTPASDVPSPRAVLKIAVEAAKAWIEDAAPRLAAAISFTTLFSLAPLLILVIAIAGVVWGNQPGVVQERLLAEVAGLVGGSGAQVIGTMLQNAERPGEGGLLATIVGIVTLVVGATALFAQLQDALNAIWGVKPSPRVNALVGFIRQRLLSFGMILTVCFLLLVSLVVSVALGAVSDTLGMQGVLLHLLNVVVSIAIITALFALIYRYLPDARIAWRDVWVGALVTAVLFTVGKLLIGLYLGNSTTASTYGAAGSLVVLLSWIYYSAMILLYGAEVTQAYATRFGQGVIPNANAVRVVTETVEVDPATVQHASKRQEKALVAQAAAPLATGAGPAAAPPAHRPGAMRQALPVVAAFIAGRLTKRS